jgi:hypothetical protein
MLRSHAKSGGAILYMPAWAIETIFAVDDLDMNQPMMWFGLPLVVGYESKIVLASMMITEYRPLNMADQLISEVSLELGQPIAQGRQNLLPLPDDPAL